MATITVKRDSGYADLARSYSVVLDGNVVGKLAAGESATYSVEPGRHSLRAAIDWCGSNEVSFTMEPDGAKTFAVRSTLRGLRLLLAAWYVLFDRNNYLILEQAP